MAAEFLVKRLSHAATLPHRHSPHAAAYDLASAWDGTVPARGVAVVPTDLAIALPTGTYGRVAPRSGLAAKWRIDTGAGVIDADYRGNIGVVLFNHADQDFTVRPGDRVAQLILQHIATPPVREVTELPATVRGADGFGSTGVQETITNSPPRLLKAQPLPSVADLLVKRLTNAATLPVRSSENAAAYDLASAQDLVIPAHGLGLVPTDLAIAIPAGTYARVAPRSGLAIRHKIDVGAGVVDADYRGHVQVVLFNHGGQGFAIKKGDRVAQLLLECIVTPPITEVSELPETQRGTNGFGSTGVQAVASPEHTKGLSPSPVSQFLVKRLSNAATLPIRSSQHAAAYDLASAQDLVIPARGSGLVPTDLSVALPDGTYARVAPRSGLAVKQHIDVGAGVIDADFRGNVQVILFNHAATDFTVKKGDRIAQLILERIMTPSVTEVSELPDTQRGAKGFGSTGLQSEDSASKRPKVDF